MHRDIKPSNVCHRRVGEKDEENDLFTLMDFGGWCCRDKSDFFAIHDIR